MRMTEFTKNVFSEPSEPFLVGYVVEGAAARFRICQQKKSIWQFRRSRPNPNNDFPLSSLLLSQIHLSLLSLLAHVAIYLLKPESDRSISPHVEIKGEIFLHSL